MYLCIQTRIKCWSAGATLRAEQGPCEPSKGFVSKFGEQKRAREGLREPERVGQRARESQRGQREAESEPREPEKARKSPRASQREPEGAR